MAVHVIKGQLQHTKTAAACGTSFLAHNRELSWDPLYNVHMHMDMGYLHETIPLSWLDTGDYCPLKQQILTIYCCCSALFNESFETFFMKKINLL